MKVACDYGLRRMEEAARTEEDFTEVVRQWDMIDSNNERKARRYEVSRTEELIYYRMTETPKADKYNFEMVLEEQRRKGDFIDTIFDHVETIGQLVTNEELTYVLDNLNHRRKNLLFYIVIHYWEPKEYAETFKMTERNVRGTKDTALKKVRNDFKKKLEDMEIYKIPMTIDERYFYENGVREKPEKIRRRKRKS